MNDFSNGLVVGLTLAGKNGIFGGNISDGYKIGGLPVDGVYLGNMPMVVINGWWVSGTTPSSCTPQLSTKDPSVLPILDKPTTSYGIEVT